MSLKAAALAGAILAVLSAPAPAAAPRVTVSFRHSPFASRFWCLERLSNWDGGSTSERYRAAWSQRFPITPFVQERLDRYARLRRTRSAQTPAARPDEWRILHPVTEAFYAPKSRSSDAWTIAFLESSSAAQAAERLRLTDEEAKVVDEALRALAGPMDALAGESPGTREASELMSRLAKRSHLERFASRAAAFFGTPSTADLDLKVDLVLVPRGAAISTTIQNHMVVAVSSAAMTERAAADHLGVVVHEFGHYLSGQLPDAELHRVSDRLVDALGLLRRRRMNVVDEAVQTALGNILFVRQNFPDALEPDDTFIDYDPAQEYPSALDSLARALEGPLARRLDSPGSYQKEFLDDVIAAYRGLFPPRPRDYAHAALLLYSDPRELAWFKRQFWDAGLGAFALTQAEEFERYASAMPDRPRWLLATTADLDAAEAAAARFSLPSPRGLRARVGPEGAPGCLSAARRPGGGLGFTLLARDRDGLRETLHRVWDAAELPGSAPFCAAARSR